MNLFKKVVKKVMLDPIEEELERLIDSPTEPTKIPDLIPKTPEKEAETTTIISAKHQGLKTGDKLKLDKNPTTTYLVTMIFGNGSCEHLVSEPDILGFFKHRKKKYHINQKNCIWDSNENNNRLFFHENYVEPLEIKEIITSENENRMIAYVTPENVDGVIKMESVRLIAEGPDLQKWVKIGTFVSIAVLCLLLIIVIIFVAQSGIFQQIGASLQGRAMPR